jgi:hypothetical protein
VLLISRIVWRTGSLALPRDFDRTRRGGSGYDVSGRRLRFVGIAGGRRRVIFCGWRPHDLCQDRLQGFCPNVVAFRFEMQAVGRHAHKQLAFFVR